VIFYVYFPQDNLFYGSAIMPPVGKKSMTVLKKAAFFLVFSALLTGCAPVDLLNGLVPGNGYTFKNDIAYGPNYRQKLDVYMPKHPDARKTAIVFIYGGAWKSGRKGDYRFVGQGLSELGYTVIIPDYHLYPAVQYPVFIDDCARAVVWAHENADKIGINPDRIFVMGHSAGAYNAAMVAFDERWMINVGGDPKWVHGMIGLAGPYDFLPIADPSVKKVFESALDMNDTQPINHIGKGEPPAFLATGNEDEQVEARNTTDMAHKLLDNGNNVTVLSYPNVSHKGIVVSLTRVLTPDAPVRDDIKAFIERH